MAITERVATPRIDLQEAFQPRAEVVSSYVRPATPAKSSLWDLAEGLSAFSSGLRTLMSKRQAESDKQDAIRGEAAFYKANSAGYAEAVRTGKLPSFESPEFVSGYKKAEGAALGKRLVSKFELAYSTWGGRNGQDPAAFDKFMSDFVSQNLTTDDPDILDGALPYIEQLTNRGYSLNTQERADGLYAGSLDAHIASSDQDVDLAMMAGTASGSGPDTSTLWEALMANRGAAVSTGIRDEDYDKKLIDLVIFKAQESGEEDLLKLLDNTVPGTSHTYATTQYGREQMAAAAQGIQVAKRQAEERAYTMEQRQDAAMKDQMEAFAIEKLAADPNYVFGEDFLTEYAKYDPQARINVRDWGRKLAEGIPEDDEAVLGLYDRILKGEDPSSVIRTGMDNGIIRKPETLKGLIAFKTPTVDVGRFTSNAVYKSSLGALRQAATPEDMFYNPDAMSPAAVAVQLDFEKAMTGFLTANPRATDLEISEEAARVYGVLSKGIAEPGQYATPTAAEVSENPLVQSEAEVTQQAADKAAFEASPEGQMDVWAKTDGPPALDTLPPEERRALEEAGAAMGIDPAVLADRTWQEMQRMLQEERAQNQVEEDINTIIDQGIGDPGAIQEQLNQGGDEPVIGGEVGKVKPILDLLGEAEGTDKGRSYDETLGYGAYTGGEVQLTSMTLNEVRQLQRDMLKHPGNTWNSSAVGRYQIVGRTLARLMRKLNLSGNELFTAELQDRLALELLKGRGLDKWLAGDLSTRRFMTSLSKEWASLPKSNGKGSYGQGLGANVKQVLAALTAVQA